MRTYLVEYTEEQDPNNLTWGAEHFLCSAENNLHAREQCHDAYPGCIVLSIDRVPDRKAAH